MGVGTQYRRLSLGEFGRAADRLPKGAPHRAGVHGIARSAAPAAPHLRGVGSYRLHRLARALLVVALRSEGMTMRALVMEGFGASDQASPGTLAKPQCRPGDLLVRVAAAGVNPSDLKEMAGNFVNFYPSCGSRWAPGVDAAGIVEEAGEGVAGFTPGDRVVLMSDG